MNKYKLSCFTLVLFAVLISCSEKSVKPKEEFITLNKYANNNLDYKFSPKHKFDKKGLMFSDNGAWFAYSLSDSLPNKIGFSGPFLMTQQNGIWSSEKLSYLNIKNQEFKFIKSNSYPSHLEQTYASSSIEVKQSLFYISGHSAFIISELKNIGDKPIEIDYRWKNTEILADSLRLTIDKNIVNINSSKSNAKGYIVFPEETKINLTDNSYITKTNNLKLEPNQIKSLSISQTFIFPEYSWKKELQNINLTNLESILSQKKAEKNGQLEKLVNNRKPKFENDKYAEVLAKSYLTLQNNWRIPAGEIKHEGLFPSYHYRWFNGFWSWDSWKHAVGLSYYNTDLAKKQVKLMFEFQNDDGFVADCVYRDTLIENHNYRDTKPPLSAWSVAKIYEKDKDLEFVKYMYPKLVAYHNWWYNKRDHDKDGLCEYGSTDGSLVAAKWESGMDNAIRFDNSKILKNTEGAYSLDQESVDLNAYLYAEKLFLVNLAKAINNNEDSSKFNDQAKALKLKIQQQFYDENDGWFYDTNLAGNEFIKGEGSEGWTALWAKAASNEQAESVKIKMMDSTKFYTKVPFQTMSADHEKFNPLKGYWRGPNWLDQAYFGVKSLRNYGYNQEADEATIQLLKGAEGILGKGKAIRENYHPITGKGLNAKNFSWSAAHIIMLLQKD